MSSDSRPESNPPESGVAESQSDLKELPSMRSWSLAPPDISQLSVKEGDFTTKSYRRPVHPPAAVRSVSDVGPQRPDAQMSSSSSSSSGTSSPLAHVQAARSGGMGLASRPQSGSAASSTPPLPVGGVGKLPAGVQAKMMAVSTIIPNLMC